MLPLAGCVSDFVEAILAKHTGEALGNKAEGGLDFEALSKKAEELAEQVKETIEINSGLSSSLVSASTPTLANRSTRATATAQ